MSVTNNLFNQRKFVEIEPVSYDYGDFMSLSKHCKERVARDARLCELTRINQLGACGLIKGKDGKLYAKD